MMNFITNSGLPSSRLLVILVLVFAVVISPAAASGKKNEIVTLSVKPLFYAGGQHGDLMMFDVKYSKKYGSEITKIKKWYPQPNLRVGDFIISIGGKSLLKKNMWEQGELWKCHGKNGCVVVVRGVSRTL